MGWTLSGQKELGAAERKLWNAGADDQQRAPHFPPISARRATHGNVSTNCLNMKRR